MPNKRSAQFNTVLHCLRSLERIGYHMPGFSYLKIQALHGRNLDVPQVSERMASFNQMDVVSRIRYQINVYLFLLLYERFLIFFCLCA
jgi:hypothetical protein